MLKYKKCYSAKNIFSFLYNILCSKVYSSRSKVYSLHLNIFCALGQNTPPTLPAGVSQKCG